MSSGRKCKNCGGTDIEVDAARGDAVCTNCGSVLEDSIIVAEVQFEEGARGTSSAIGQFVSADSKGGATKFGASFHVGVGIESREITLKKARTGIAHLCNQLKLNQHCIDTACSFFKMALSRNLTKGRRNTHVHAACVYLTCRTEGTAHLLIDISDVLQICCYELGRTYLRLSQALCINIPAVDPCLYILRFAAKLQFGNKTQQVANTALRLVQRMKRDSIHSGRRPSGLCGAALLMAARLHEFNRSTSDIIKIVKVHESTIKKRLIEFGDTPSSALTLEEFMTVDLEEEQDPPSFKAARKKDKERLQKLLEEESESLTELQKQIEVQLDTNGLRRKIPKVISQKVEEEQADTNRFIKESTLGVVRNIMEENVDDPEAEMILGLGPDVESMGLATSLDDTSNAQHPGAVEMTLTNFDDIDDEEIDTYILTEKEFQCKNGLWYERNATYLEEQKAKAERLAKEREEAGQGAGAGTGKPDRKRKRGGRKRTIAAVSSAGEAIEKILQEKKISAKINYDVLKSLNAVGVGVGGSGTQQETKDVGDEKMQSKFEETDIQESTSRSRIIAPNFNKPSANHRVQNETAVKPAFKKEQTDVKQEGVQEPEESANAASEEELEDDYDEEPPVEEPSNEMGVLQMLRQHREGADDENEDFGYNYYEEPEDY